jgi:hypothetical protein
MTRVRLYDQNDSHFATFDMPELPRVGDSIEIGFLENEVVKTFDVERVVHKMLQFPVYDDVPWIWEIRLHGTLIDPAKRRVCTCSKTPNETKCEAHGHQSGGRELCPLCQESYLGYCAEGQYCTDDTCRYVS